MGNSTRGEKVVMLKVNCPSCGFLLDIPVEYAGKSGGCARCKGTFTVPTLQHTPAFSEPDRMSMVMQPIDLGLDEPRNPALLKPVYYQSDDMEHRRLFSPGGILVLYYSVAIAIAFPAPFNLTAFVIAIVLYIGCIWDMSRREVSGGRIAFWAVATIFFWHITIPFYALRNVNRYGRAPLVIVAVIASLLFLFVSAIVFQ